MKNLRVIAENKFYDKGLPSNVEAERTILGAILLDNAVCDSAIELVDADDFFLECNAILFEGMCHLWLTKAQVDLILLSDWLRGLKPEGQFERIGGATYIASLTDGVPRTDNIEHYAALLKKKKLLRDMITVSSIIQARCFDEEEADEVLSYAEDNFFHLGEQRETRQAEQIGETGQRVLEGIERRSGRSEHMVGVPTGLTDLDMFLLGLQPGLNLLVARPSHGKTSLASSIGEYASKDGKHIVLDFSMEMSAEARVMRMLASLARVDSHRLRTGYLNREEWSRLADAVRRMCDMSYYIDDTPALTVAELHAKSRRFKARFGLDLIIADHVQQMTNMQTHATMDQDAKEISRGLVKVWKDLKVPVLALSQASRACEQRGDKHIVLSDIRESGNWEQDADVVMALYNRSKYSNLDEDRGIVDLDILKARDGPTGRVELVFVKEFTRFENMWRE